MGPRSEALATHKSRWLVLLGHLALLTALGSFGCKKINHRQAPAAQATTFAKIRYAAVTEAAVQGQNDNFFAVEEDAALFTVVDGVVKSATLPDPARAAAKEFIRPFPSCSGKQGANLLVCALAAANTNLTGTGSTAALTSVFVESDSLTLAIAGSTTTAYWARQGKLVDLSKEHGALEVVGTRDDWKIATERVSLQAGDQILLGNSWLTSSFSSTEILSALSQPDIDTEAKLKSITNVAKTKGLSDDMTAILLEIAPKTSI